MQINIKALCRAALYSFPSSNVPAITICNISDLQPQLLGRRSQSPGPAQRSAAEEPSPPGMLWQVPAPRGAAAPRAQRQDRPHAPEPRGAAGLSEARRDSAGTQLHILLLAALPAVPTGTTTGTAAGTAQRGAAPHGHPRADASTGLATPRARKSRCWAETLQTCFGDNVYIFSSQACKYWGCHRNG